MADLDGMSLAQLKTYAKENDISIKGLTLKDDILFAIKNAISDEDEEEVLEYVTVETFVEDMKKLEQKIMILEKKLLETTRRARKARLRQARFTGYDLGMDTLADPLGLSLEELEKKNYAMVPSDIEYPGDSEPSDEEKEEYRKRLDKELDEIHLSIHEHYDFKMPEVVFTKPISLAEFLDLKIDDVDFDANKDEMILKLGKNVVKLPCYGPSKVQLIMERCIVRLVYYVDKWLITADRL